MNLADVAARLRNARPSKLRVVLNDETEKAVAMPRGRERWSKAAQIIDAMPWATVYPLDAQGAICAEPINRDDGAPAGELEDLDLEKHKNPTLAIVHAVMSGVGTVLRDVHKTATVSAYELVHKVRGVHATEMQSVLAGYNALLEKTLDRNVAFEERSNQLMAENDDLRAQIAELRHADKGAATEELRERALIKALGVDVETPTEKPTNGA